MCLAIPGLVVEVRPLGDSGLIEGKVDFGGILKDVNLSFTPEVRAGEYVIVHVGFAIAVLDEAEARETIGYLRQLGMLEDAPAPLPPAPAGGAAPSASGGGAPPPAPGAAPSSGPPREGGRP